MMSAPLVMAGTTSCQTESTCLPAGSIVITTSAPLTEAIELSAMAAPSALAWSREAATRSKGMTLWPALTRLAAIGPPMLPRPMNAMLAIRKLLRSAFIFVLEYQFVGTDLPEIRRQHFRCHVLNSWRRPSGIAILVDHGRADAFAKIIAAEDFQRGAIFPHQTFLKRGGVARQPQQFQRHDHAAGRFLVQRLERRLRELRIVALERAENILHPVMRKPAVDRDLFGCDRPRAFAARKARDDVVDLSRGRARPQRRQRRA